MQENISYNLSQSFVSSYLINPFSYQNTKQTNKIFVYLLLYTFHKGRNIPQGIQWLHYSELSGKQKQNKFSLPMVITYRLFSSRIGGVSENGYPIRKKKRLIVKA